MPFSSRYSTPGFLTRDSLYLPRVDSVARTFRILVTFAIVLEVCGISFFQYHELLMAEVLEPKDHNKSALDESSILNCESASPSPSAWVIRKKYVELVRHTNPCIHNSENHMFFWVVPL